MDRQTLKNLFETSAPVVLPVVHVLDNAQAESNVDMALAGGCRGVFLINHDFEPARFMPIIHHVREKFPDIWLGINFLAVTGKDAFPMLAELQKEGIRVDGYWADDARIDERRDMTDQFEAEEIDTVRQSCGWNGLYFGGTAFKKQREVNPDDYSLSATIACNHMDVVTTSGVATGHSADLEKIDTFRKACGDTAIALASGITPQNAHLYAPLVDCFMVATGINADGDFYNIDPPKLDSLMKNLENIRS